MPAQNWICSEHPLTLQHLNKTVQLYSKTMVEKVAFSFSINPN